MLRNERSSGMPRKAVYSVTEVAQDLCLMSRARFYDLVRDGVMPYPVYCVRTRRPLYPADLASLCARVRETGIGIDGRFVIFYTRHQKPQPTPLPHHPKRVLPARDPIAAEMIETLKAMGITAREDQVAAAINERCPTGVREETFEVDLRAVFDGLRCRNVA